MLTLPKNKQSCSSVKGFTLIEVLIAMTILLTVLSMAVMGFSTMRRSSENAANTIQLLAPLPLVMDTVKAQIRQNPVETLNGDGAFDGVHFRWSAKTLQFLSPPDSYVVESAQTIEHEPRYRLYLVELELSYQTKTRTFNYKELAWLPEIEVKQP